MLRITKLVSICFLIILLHTKIFPQDFMMQGWYWDYPKTVSGYNWADTITNKATQLSNAGFTYIWLPPLSRASFGSNSNGYDPKDLYDLGEFDDGATGFGTRTDVDQLITQFNTAGLKAVADVVYNHRDGGRAENNPALTDYVTSYNSTKVNDGYNPFPYDRYRVVLPIGGSTGNNAGDYYFKISSSSAHARFDGYQYRVYMQTNRKSWQNLTALTELEPNGGADCNPDQINNEIELGRDMDAINEDYSGCRTDEFHLNLTTDDFYSTGDTIYIYFSKRNSDYSDMRIYGIWAAPRNADIANELVYQTYTDFTNMPSGLGTMNYSNFKPNYTNTTKLDGDWDWLWFFYDYDQNVPATKTALFDWTRWLWNNVGIRGLRMDAVKHFPPEFVGDLLDNLHSNGIDPGIVVGEFYDANSLLLKNWINDVYAYMDESTKQSIVPRVFDFSLRSALEQASDAFGYDVRNIFNASIVDAQNISGSNVITFVNNHDFRDAGQPVDNDPVLAYAYILTNNQVGLPCVFYPDYYSVTGFNGGLKTSIDALINVHKDFIYGSTSRDYLTRFSTPYNPFFFTPGQETTTLVYQLMNIPTGKDVIVAINYAGEPLDMWVGVNSSGLSEGNTLGDQIGNALLNTLIVSGGRVNIKLPARSYAVWVEGEIPLPVELTSFSATTIGKDVKLSWNTATEINNYRFEIERKILKQVQNDIWQKIGFVNGSGNSNSPKDYLFVDENVSAGKYYYRLKQIDNDGQFEYSKTIEVDINGVLKYELTQNYPNPFNPTTKISWEAPVSSWQTLRVYDVLGNEIATLVNEYREAGRYSINFDASNMPSGVYIYKLQAGDFTQTRKMTLLK